MITRFDPIPAGLAADLAGCGFDLHPAKSLLPQCVGAYILLIHLKNSLTLDLPRLLADSVGPGWYAYAGSAYGPGGLPARLARHERKTKRLHWHIDRLTIHARPYAIPIVDGNECAIVSALLTSDRFYIPIPGFGSTDCRICRSHLLAWTA